MRIAFLGLGLIGGSLARAVTESGAGWSAAAWSPRGSGPRRGLDLGVDYTLTVSCYQATETGLACGKCDSCRLRRQGFVDAGVEDPTRYR